MARRRRGGLVRILGRIVVGALILGLVVSGAVAGFATFVFLQSRPVLDGDLRIGGLTAPASVARDAAGVPVITAANRADLARATGFVHAQERFFQMDLLRRAGAGELSALVGGAALPIDRVRRVHRFRTRAAAALAAMTPEDRALLTAYAQGVNAGLAALGHAPWEYTLLRVSPTPWTEADTALVVYAMYFDLQDSDASAQLQNQATLAALGPVMAAFLYPAGVPADAPLDGSHFTEPAMPASRAPGQAGAGVVAPPPTPGSNNFAVAGRLSETGAAMVENDMHLGLTVPTIWYRARMVVPGSLDLVGVTLPGVPFLTVGSNTHVAWAFTDSYIESGDAVVVETLAGDADSYKTPDGPRHFSVVTEKICAAHGGCEDLQVRDTIWGPVVGQDLSGHPVVWRWMAHDDNAVRVGGFVDLERARTVRQALDAAHGAGLPDENFVVGDSDGHIAWTVIGQVPRRFGLDDQLPHSWAGGDHGWRGYLTAADIPEVIDPPDGRLWSANARVAGGKDYATLGNGGYAGPERARAIHDDLFQHTRFAERDLLAIATDDRNPALVPWQAVMLRAIDAHPAAGNLRQAVADWGGRAVPESIGYRLVREFRGEVLRRTYRGLAGALGPHAPLGRNPDRPCLRLLDAQPAALVPPPYRSWGALLDAALDAVRADAQRAEGGVAHYRWGDRNRVGIGHPLAAVVPGLHFLTDPPDVPVAGDDNVPRVAIPGFGASERIVVSPGHEERAVFDMPVGQSDHPFSPYYGAGQEDWVAGRATPLLPGAAKWTLRLVPGG